MCVCVFTDAHPNLTLSADSEPLLVEPPATTTSVDTYGDDAFEGNVTPVADSDYAPKAPAGTVRLCCYTQLHPVLLLVAMTGRHIVYPCV